LDPVGANEENSNASHIFNSESRGMEMRKRIVALTPAQNAARLSQDSKSLSENGVVGKYNALRVWTPEFHHVSQRILKFEETTAVAMS
jgi:hypothetical protein